MYIGNLLRWSTLLAVVPIFLVIVLPMIYGENQSKPSLPIDLFSAALIALCIFLLFWLPIVIYSIIIQARSVGILGEHLYTITPDLFTEQTSVNKTESSWLSIKSVRMNKYAIYVIVKPYSMHILPRRCFNCQESYINAYKKIKSCHQNA